jgi:plasmid maintenance system antidote protein VapI
MKVVTGLFFWRFSMNNKKLRLKVIERFDNQANFAQTIGMDESAVSRILNNRKKLRPDEAKNWQRFLDCSFDLLNPITKSVGIES